MCLSEHSTPPGSLFSNMRPSHYLAQCDFLFFKQLDLEAYFMGHFKSSVAVCTLNIKATYMYHIGTILFSGLFDWVVFVYILLHSSPLSFLSFSFRIVLYISKCL